LHLHGFFLYSGIFDLPTCGISGGIHIDGAALHACINGYYYGTQKAKVPAKGTDS